jgi:hypothetical protein
MAYGPATSAVGVGNQSMNGLISHPSQKSLQINASQQSLKMLSERKPQYASEKKYEDQVIPALKNQKKDLDEQIMEYERE